MGFVVRVSGIQFFSDSNQCRPTLGGQYLQQLGRGVANLMQVLCCYFLHQAAQRLVNQLEQVVQPRPVQATTTLRVRHGSHRHMAKASPSLTGDR